MKIAALTGDNSEVAVQLDPILTAQAKVKNMIMEQSSQIAYQRGRITELEKTPARTQGTNEAQHTDEVPPEPVKPSCALVVTSGNMEKKDMANTEKDMEVPPAVFTLGPPSAFFPKPCIVYTILK